MLETAKRLNTHILSHSQRREAKDITEAIALIELRDKALQKSSDGLKTVCKDLSESERFALSATDLFVEKAQKVLTRRYHTLFAMGIVVMIITLGIIVGAVVIAAKRLDDPIELLVVLSTPALLLRLFQATTLAAFILIAVKLLIALGRSFFHEALSLTERRHALRFGRLYVYLRRGSVSDKALEDAFQWNKETRTSFLDFKPERVAETLLHKVIEVFGGMPPATVRAVGAVVRRTQRKGRNPLTLKRGV